jgi:PAS domain S-box-containing protein
MLAMGGSNDIGAASIRMARSHRRPTVAEALDRAQAIVDGLAFGFISLNAEGDVTDCNAAAERLFGCSHRRLAGLNLWTLAGIPLDSPFVALCQRVGKTRRAEEAEILFPDVGVQRLLWVRVFPLGDGVAALCHDISAIRQAELRLDEREARYREVAEHSPAAAWLSTPDGAIEFVNQAMADALGRPREELLGDGWVECVDKADLDAMLTARAEIRADRRPFHYAGRFRLPGGDVTTVDLYGRPRFDRQGRFLGHVGTLSDAPMMRRAEKLQRLITTELSHRLKNTLMTVLSLVSQSLRECDAPREAEKLVTERLCALSAAHDVLTREKWEGAELVDIVNAAAKSYVGARLILDGPPARVPAGVAVALSMALHELATNAAKYGSLSVPGGSVRLSWQKAGRCVDIEWRETGGPIVHPRQRVGFGSHLLERGIAGELDGPATVVYDPSGLVCTLRAPILDPEAPSQGVGGQVGAFPATSAVSLE